MAIDANRRAVGIAVDSPVIRVGLRLVAVRSRVTNDAGECRIVGRHGMAIGTDRAVVRNLEPRMVKGSAQPIGSGPRRVASHAGRRVLRGDVIWHGPTERLRAQPSRLMAPVAIGVRGRQAVVAVDVARCAGCGDVHALERPSCRAVIELSICPKQRVVAR